MARYSHAYCLDACSRSANQSDSCCSLELPRSGPPARWYRIYNALVVGVPVHAMRRTTRWRISCPETTTHVWSRASLDIEPATQTARTESRPLRSLLSSAVLRSLTFVRTHRGPWRRPLSPLSISTFVRTIVCRVVVAVAVIIVVTIRLALLRTSASPVYGTIESDLPHAASASS